jgi:hypothetical protein
METEGSLIFKLAKRVAEQPTADEHLRAVQAQLQVANQILFALFRIVADQNGLAAESLLRTLFESAVNGAILAKHKELLGDFIQYGEFTSLRLLRFTDVLKERIDPIIKLTEEDWAKLLPRFKSRDWHSLGTRDSFVEAEFEPMMYDKYFRRASTFAHAEPYVTVRRKDETWKNWTVEARPDLWATFAGSAYVLGCGVMLHLLRIMNREFRLGIDEEVNQLIALVDALRTNHAEVMKRSVEG